MIETSFHSLNDRIIHCKRCPRLVYHRENVPIRTPLGLMEPWRKPVPGFGDENAWLFILGLAPSSEGGNRTGRVFTGDESGRFLFKALYQAGLANQSSGETPEDGLKLLGCYITAAVKCVPPQHKPLREEFVNCSSYFENELFLLKKVKVVLALGKHGFDAYQGFLKKQNALKKREDFAHGKLLCSPGWPSLYGCYHPSPQNTNTGKLTLTMMVHLLKHIQKENN